MSGNVLDFAELEGLEGSLKGHPKSSNQGDPEGPLNKVFIVFMKVDLESSLRRSIMGSRTGGQKDSYGRPKGALMGSLGNPETVLNGGIGALADSMVRYQNHSSWFGSGASCSKTLVKHSPWKFMESCRFLMDV